MTTTQITDAIWTQNEIISTYEGIIAQCNNAEGCDGVWEPLARAEARKAELEAQLAEVT